MILLTKEKLKKILKVDVKKSYTYGLCKNSGELFYVGVGIRGRVFQHDMAFELAKSTNLHKVNTIKKEKLSGGIKYVLFNLNRDRQICLDTEKDLVAKFGRRDLKTGVLVNLTSGGEIGATDTVVSLETRKKLSENVQKRVDIISEQQRNYWLSLSEEAKAKRVSNMRSAHGTPEHTAKLSAAQLRKWSDPEYKVRLSKIQSVAQSALADEHRKRTTAYWANPENKEKRLEQNRLRRLEKLNKPTSSLIEKQVTAPA